MYPGRNKHAAVCHREPGSCFSGPARIGARRLPMWTSCHHRRNHPQEPPPILWRTNLQQSLCSVYLSLLCHSSLFRIKKKSAITPRYLSQIFPPENQRRQENRTADIQDFIPESPDTGGEGIK